MTTLPRLISVDDHVLEPPDLWWSRLPAKQREQGPHVRRERGVLSDPRRGPWTLGGDDAAWADVWYYDDLVAPLLRGLAQSGFVDDVTSRVVTYDEVMPGTYKRDARIAVLDENHTDVSICFPNITRFCGQIFLERKDKEVALLGVQAYNDWMIEEWCGTERPARLVPLTLVPLWDPELAAAEVRRCAAKGSHAVSFPEGPPALGLPSVFTREWDPLFIACEETDTVLNMHVGSSSRQLVSADAPVDMGISLLFVNSELAFADWLYSGVLQEFPKLRIVLSEGQVGWMPFLMQRIDEVWLKTGQNVDHGGRRATELPSSIVPDHVFGCIYDDLRGLLDRDAVGIGQIMIETDFPHVDSTYPHSEKRTIELITAAGLDDRETSLLVRENAIRVYGLDRYFGITA